jgi:purine-binding chemotaxis protein CheW
MAQAELINQEFQETGEHSLQYLTFSVAGEEYGVDILDVQEVKVWTRVTSLPNTPDYVKGVLNLRGNIVPIIDLRTCFNLETINYDATTVIIVLKLNVEDKERIIGLVADSVSDVLDIDTNLIRDTDKFDVASQTDAITGLATLDTKMVILLDATKLLSTGELADLSTDASRIKKIAEVEAEAEAELSQEVV